MLVLELLLCNGLTMWLRADHIPSILFAEGQLLIALDGSSLGRLRHSDAPTQNCSSGLLIQNLAGSRQNCPDLGQGGVGSQSMKQLAETLR